MHQFFPAMLAYCLAQRTNYFLSLAGSLLILAVISSSGWSDRVFAQISDPSLTIPQAIPALVGRPVTVPIHFRTGGAEVASLIFSIDFDEACLGFDATDTNHDGQPDSVRFNNPAGLRGSVAYSATDRDGELDFVIADYSPPIATLPDTDELVTIAFTPRCTPTPAPISVAVAFSDAPAISFGAPNGNDLTGSGSDGTIEIANPLTPTVTATATFAPTVSAPATLTPSPTPLAMPTMPHATPEPTSQLSHIFLPWIGR